MRRLSHSAFVVAAVMILPRLGIAQAGMDASRSVAGGGISAPGWMGAVDPTEGSMSVKDAKLSLTGNVFSVTTGPAITYWNPGQQGERRLHREGDLHGAEVPEPEQSSAPVRHHDRRQRSRHADRRR